MQIIPVSTAEMEMGPIVMYDEGDLVWVSQVQLEPADFEWYLPVNGAYPIPCDLGIVKRILYADDGNVWGIEVQFAGASRTEGVYINDVMLNLTKFRKLERQIMSAYTIQRAYRIHMGIRTIMAKRIQRAYIRHFWDPLNPNMQERLLRDFEQLCPCKKA